MGKALQQKLSLSAVLFALVFSAWGVQAQTNISGIYESYLILDLGSGSTFYDLQATSANPNFTGSLGSFVQCTGTPLTLKGAQNKTFKCPSCDITNGTLFYRVYPQGGTPGTFTSLNLGFGSNDPGASCPGGQNQTWQESAATVNLLSGRAPGVYVLEVYTAANYQGCGTGTHLADNGGTYYSATFTVTGGASCPVFVTASGGTGFATYTTLNAAFTAINAGTHTGTIAITIGANTTEPAVAVPLLRSNSPSNYSSITIKPSGNVIVNSAAAPTASRGVIEFNGADNVTIDGDDPATPGTRNLTFQAAAVTTTGVTVIRFASSSTTDGATFNTLKNCIVIGSRSAATSTVTTFGIYSGTSGTSNVSTSGQSDNNDNLTIENNEIRRCAYGIYCAGTGTNYMDNLIIRNNVIGSATAADDIATRGIYVQNTQAVSTPGASVAIIEGNDIRGTQSSSSTTAINGIEIANGNAGLICRANKIHDVTHPNTSGYGAYGIHVTGSGNNSGVTIVNNFIWDMKSTNWSTSISPTVADLAVGIRVSVGATGLKIYHNSISINAANFAPTTAGYSGCIQLTTTGITGADIRNNIFSMTQTGGTGSKYYCMIVPASFPFGTLDNNDYWVTGTNLVAYNGADRATLALWQAQTTKDVSSVSVNPSFTSGADLHIPAATVTLLESGGAAVGVTTDIDGDARPNGFAPDIGADEFSGTNPNICSGTPTAGTISSSPLAICNSGTAILTLNGATTGVGISYQWKEATTPGGPYTNVGTNAATFTTGTITSARYYVVDVTCSNGPNTATTAEYTLAVNPLPTVSVSPTSGLICNPAGAAVALTASGASTYSWSPATGLDMTTGATVSANPAATTTYTVTGTDGNGCVNTATVTVTVASKPAISLITATPATICSGENSQLNVVAGEVVNTFVGGGITINTSGNAAPYPSNISISGVPGTITSLKVTVTNLSHTYPSDIDVVLFGPTGAHSIIFTDAIGTSSVTGRTYTFQTGATALPLTGSPASGTYGVVNGSSYNGTGTPSAVSNTGLGAFNSTDPNGTWSLYVFDDATGDGGSIGSWSLEITTGAAVSTYSWSPATFLNDAAIANPLASNVTATTAYTVTATAASGCFATADVTVNVNPTPTATVSGGGTVCSTDPLPNVSFALTGTGPWDLTYNDGTNNIPVMGIASSPYTITNALVGTYTVVSVSDANCAGTGSGSVTVAVTPATTWYLDSDGDSYGNAGMSQIACSQPSGYVADNTDCDDSEAGKNPGATEICDGLDNDCDGNTDEGLTYVNYYLDGDNDGYGDENATPIIACAPPGPLFVTNNDDCDDSDNTINPLATEICDGLDNNCNGMTDEGVQTTYYLDADGDNYYTGSPVMACSSPGMGYVTTVFGGGDCVDNDPFINPGVTEICDGIDNNCNGQTDEGLLTTYYRDMDNDGYGNPSNTIQACTQPGGYVSNSDDCDDNDANTYAGYTLLTSGTFSPIPGSGSGVLLGDDQVSGGLPVGFDFNFYGVNYSTFYISTNGFITFASGFDSGCCGGQNIPNASTPNNLIAIAWDDLYPPGGGSINYFTTGTAPNRILVVNYANIPLCCGFTPAVNAQIQLYETSNRIEFHTSFINGINPGTMGIENPGGTLARTAPGRNSSAWSTSNDFVAFIPCGTATSTFYRDNDGDGFGDPLNTTTGLTAPPGYVSDNTDCNDNNALEKPGQIWYADLDNDGYSSGVTQVSCLRPVGHKAEVELASTTIDCNDNNPAIKPGATEICDNIDNNCNGMTDEGVQTTFYQDFDGDGFGDPSISTLDCTAPGGYVTNNTDCDDNDALEKPGQIWYADLDNDGYSSGVTQVSCLRPVGYKVATEMIAPTEDCNDNNPAIKPGATEICDGIDNNCNGMTDEGVLTTYYRDQDGDGFGNPTNTTQACFLPSGYVNDNTDCDDNDALEKPGQTWYADLDNDGYSSGVTQVSCLRPAGHKVAGELAAATVDCNDNDEDINPAATEVCDGIDNDCNGMTDEGVLTTYYRDQDGDGFGNPTNTTQACSQPSGFVTNNTDCDDNDPLEKPGQVWYADLDDDGFSSGVTQVSCLRPAGHKVAVELASTTVDCNDNDEDINPAATEVCDNIDNNCNGSIDEGVLITYYRDQDGDGFGNPSNTTQACSLPPGYVTNNQDCNDNNPLEKPGQTWYADLDNDGYSSGVTQVSCLRPVGYKVATEMIAPTEDCNDNNPAIKPGATEICDGIDNNCDGSIDEGVLITYYRDQDGDGFGNPSNTTQACSLPPGYVTNNQDCNDNNALEKPGQVWYADLDNDGYSSGVTQVSCLRPAGYKVAAEMIAPTGDCNDNNAAIKPGAAEICDGVDNNCNGQIDEPVAISSPWSSANVGSGANGGANQACSPGNLTTFNVSAQGYSTPTGDVTHTVFQQLCGNASITVRVASVSNDGWAGITMRESLAGGSRMVALKTQLANIGIREARNATNGPKQTQIFPATLLHEWLRITRSGNTFQYFISPDGTNWQLVGTVNIAMGSCLYVGMFAESINVNTTTIASFTNVSVSGGVLPLTGSPDTPTENAYPVVEKIHEFSLPEFSLRVYPNPSSGEVNIDLEDYLGRAVRIEVYSMLGQMVYFVEIDEVQTAVTKLDLSVYQNGTYLIRVHTDGEPDATKWVKLLTP